MIPVNGGSISYQAKERLAICKAAIIEAFSKVQASWIGPLMQFHRKVKSGRGSFLAANPFANLWRGAFLPCGRRDPHMVYKG